MSCSKGVLGSNCRLGVGTASFGDCYGDVEFEECRSVVNHALDHGITHFDTAQWYGNGKSELILGQILKPYPRNSFTISTKVGRSSPVVSEMFNFHYDRILADFDKSLHRLNVEYVDILFAHDVEFEEDESIILKETIPALQKIKESKKARLIGISGYPLEKLINIISQSNIKIDVVQTYSRYTLFDQSLNNYIKFFKDREIFVICGSPTGMGLLTNNGPPSWHPGSTALKERCSEVAREFKKNNLDISKCAIRYVLENSDINMVFIGPKSVMELNSCLDAYVSRLSSKEWDFVKSQKERFKNLSDDVKNWECVEINKYKLKLQKIN